jgi:hypothetical protein
MQKLDGYITTQYLKVLYSPNTATINRNRIVYARPLKLYRGITNTLQLRLLNTDQKPEDISGKSFVFNIIDQSTQVVINSKTGTLVDPTQVTNVGLVDFEFTDSDLRNADAGYYVYSVYELLSDGSKSPVFSNDNFDADGELRVYDTAYSGFVDSQEVNFDTMTESTDVDYSDIAQAYPHLNQNTALHTAQYYLDNYTGTITVEATLDADPNGETGNWYTVSSTTYTANTGTEYVTFNGVYTAVRFKSDKTTGTITKVLYRP